MNEYSYIYKKNSRGIFAHLLLMTVPRAFVATDHSNARGALPASFTARSRGNALMNTAHLHAYALRSFRFRLVNTDFCDARFWHKTDRNGISGLL